MMGKRTFLILAPFVLAGCSGEEHQDLRAWIKEQDSMQRPRIEPLPEARQRAGPLRPQALPSLGPARSPMLTEKYPQHISVVCSHGLNFIYHV